MDAWSRVGVEPFWTLGGVRISRKDPRQGMFIEKVYPELVALSDWSPSWGGASGVQVQAGFGSFVPHLGNNIRVSVSNNRYYHFSASRRLACGGSTGCQTGGNDWYNSPDNVLPWTMQGKSEDYPIKVYLLDKQQVPGRPIWPIPPVQGDSLDQGYAEWHICMGNVLGTACYVTDPTCDECSWRGMYLVEGRVRVKGAPASELRYDIRRICDPAQGCTKDCGSKCPRTPLAIGRARAPDGLARACILGEERFLTDPISVTLYASDSSTVNTDQAAWRDRSVMVSKEIGDHGLDPPQCPSALITSTPVYSAGFKAVSKECQPGDPTKRMFDLSIDITEDAGFKRDVVAGLFLAREVADDLRNHASRRLHVDTRSETGKVFVEYPDSEPYFDAAAKYGKSLSCAGVGGIWMYPTYRFASDNLAHEYGHHLHGKFEGGGGTQDFAEGYANFHMWDKELSVGHRGRTVHKVHAARAESANSKVGSGRDDLAIGEYFLDLSDPDSSELYYRFDPSLGMFLYCASDGANMGAYGIFSELSLISSGIQSVGDWAAAWLAKFHCFPPAMLTEFREVSDYYEAIEFPDQCPRW